MNILVTGNQGYIGSVLTPLLQAEGHDVTGFDCGYFSDCLLEPIPSLRQITKDIRKIEPSDFEGIEGVIHLAGLSNDPLGEFDPDLTEEINLRGTLRAAAAAKEAGVSRFVFASSQSMYGVSLKDEELGEDNSEKNPVTAYARTKWEAELGLAKLCSETFLTTYFRPSTVFGASPRLRSDIVFNNLVGCAFTTGKIEIKSDGTPWRPVVHIQDVCRAFMAGLFAPADVVRNRAFNVGIPNGNFTVRDLAEAAQASVPGSELVFTGEHGSDSRTYRVSFDRILTELSSHFSHLWDLLKGGNELVEFYNRVGFTTDDFRGRKTIRLSQLKHLIAEGSLDAKLFFKN